MKHKKSILRNHNRNNRKNKAYVSVYKPTYVYQPTYNNGSFIKSCNNNFDKWKLSKPEEKAPTIPKDWLWQIIIALLSALSPLIVGGIIKLVMAYLC